MNGGRRIVFVNPGDRHLVYQGLGNSYAAIEPPVWLAVLAAFLREHGWDVMIIDANAKQLSPEEVSRQVASLDPLLAVVIVGGSQPSASTQNMPSARKICSAIKEGTDCKVALGGLHPSALPPQSLQEEPVDFVVDGEGPLTLLILAETLFSGKQEYTHVPGLWYWDDPAIRSNKRAELIDNLDSLPQAAWDLLPMHLYRAHNWHCFDHIDERAPYASIYTSLGCPYSCLFCCINAPFGKPGIRYRSPESVAEEIGMLVQRYKVRNIKVMDELFVFDERHYMGVVDLILEKQIDVNIWAYARVDTVKAAYLPKMKKAGINWLALGIESANPAVRDGAHKKMRAKDIKGVVQSIQDAGIRVIGNYIFGLPDDTRETMQETLDMASDLKCEFANFYCAIAYPGSKLYRTAVEEQWPLPADWGDFSQHSYGTLPLPTRHVSAKDVLAFRDEAFHTYFGDGTYLDMMEQRFGARVRQHLEEMTEQRLRRKLLENYDKRAERSPKAGDDMLRI